MKKLLTLAVILVVAVASFSAKKTVEFWTISLSPWFDGFINSVISNFEKENPDIDVKWTDVPADGYEQKLTAAIASGKAPDLVNLNTQWALQFAANKAIQPIDPYITSKDKAAYFDKLWNATVVDKKSYSIPWYVSPMVMIYNTKIFKDAGLDPNKPPKTWAEMLDYARIIKQKTGKYGLFQNPGGFDVLFEGTKLISADKKKAAFNTPDAVNLLKWFQTLYKEELMPRTVLDPQFAYEDAQQKYLAGELGMWPIGLSMLKHVKNNAPEVFKNTAVAQYPLAKGKVINVDVMNFSLTSKSKNPKEAVKFGLFIGSPKWQIEFCKYATIVPPTKIGLDSDKYFMDKADEDMLVKGQIIASQSMTYGSNFFAVTGIPNKYYGEFRRIADDYWLKAIEGKYTAEEALKLSEKEINAVLAK